MIFNYFLLFSHTLVLNHSDTLGLNDYLRQTFTGQSVAIKADEVGKVSSGRHVIAICDAAVMNCDVWDRRFKTFYIRRVRIFVISCIANTLAGLSN
jgi:hypothetical protein